MKTGSKFKTWHWGLMLSLLCFCSIPQMAGAVPSIPTGPGAGQNGAGGIPDYYTTANWANSYPMAKFVDTLPGLTIANKNNLDQFLPIAKPDPDTFPGSDYYIIKLVEYSKKMHSDLNPTKLRGYVQLKADGITYEAEPNYLGPVIIATKDRPVRLKFINGLPNTANGGDLFLPVDESVMGAGLAPDGVTKYSQNRANIHLHGGRTPWISDGTPHQWITPADEGSAYMRGVSVQNVPDMCFDNSGNAISKTTDPDCLTGSSDPGPGANTYYFTNQQSTRLMFYHDHAFGITRLNVYAGEAAGYVITDPMEQDLVDRGIIPGTKTGGALSMGGMIPLIIQDKTFVDATPTAHPVSGEMVPKIRITDPLWNWGSEAAVAGVVPPTTGDLWMPHVYMPAQQPTISGFGGVNPFGRWMYGPWFYPATAVTHGPVTNPYYDANCNSSNPLLLAECETPGQPPQIPGTPNVSMGMEAFQDSAVVNGTAFPTLTVDPKAYRFRILNAANDRFWNLSFYQADPAQISTAKYFNPASPDFRPNLSNKTEVKMVPASADLAAANNWPADWPVDGRDGGVPDPAFKGPSFLQIGTEGGFLPAPTIRAPQPVTYITDPTAFWVGIVDKTGLALGPAERADVIVDFSQYAGKTLILYNDAPAAWPARVPGYDFYTGAPDMRDSGGYGTGGTFNRATGAWENGTGPLVGYAPNTRTVMQVIVRSGSNPPFNQTALENEFTSNAPVTAINPEGKTLFERTQEPIIVGQAAYSEAYPDSYFPTNFPWEGVNQINDGFLQFMTLAGEEVKVPTEPKGIHDEMGASFDPEYGRMSGNLSMQLKNPTTLNALLILYGFSDIPTETINNSPTVNVQVLPNANPSLPGTVSDGTQIWKISHNGVDTHPIHFHIFDVQLINRVGWDGQIAMPEANELGWKDTIKISPLMDTIVAVRPRAPALPFGIPNSLRQLNPAIPIDSTMNFTPGAQTAGSDWIIGTSFLPPFTQKYGFNSVDWTTGQAYVYAPAIPPFPAVAPTTPAYPYEHYKGVVTNVMYDFGWEYVWHCHILSHEEMDMMRPIVLKYDAILPPAFTAKAVVNAGNVDITWTDPTPVDYNNPNIELYRNAANEVGFNVYRSIDGGANYTQLNTVNLPANTTKYTTTTVADSLYKVEAFNAKGSTEFVTIPLSVSVAATNALPINAPATVNLTATVGTAGAYTVEFFNGTTSLGSDADSLPPYTFDWANVMSGAYVITARATDASGAVAISDTITVNVTGAITVDFTATNSSYCDPAVFTASTAGTVDGYLWTIDGTNPITSTVTTTLVPGVYPVTLVVSNSGSGESTSITKNVTISNNAPVALHGGPYLILPGVNLNLNGSATDALDTCNATAPTPFTYAWNMDNKGNYDISGATPTIANNVINTLLGNGTHKIKFKVTDSKGGTAIVTTTVQVEVKDGLIPGYPTYLASALRALQITNGTITPTVLELAHGDVAPYYGNASHPDGIINLGDVSVLLMRAVGSIPGF